MSTSKDSLIHYLLNTGKGFKSWDELAKEFGIRSGEAARGLWKEYRKITKIAGKAEQQVYITQLEDKIVSLEEDKKSGLTQLLYRSKDEIKTEAELVDKAQIDLSKYRIVRVRHNYWGNSNDPHWQVRVDLEPRSLDTDKELQIKYLIEEMKNFAPKYETKQITQLAMASTFFGGEYLYELDLPDFHLGKLSWSPESGEDYDVSIAVQRYKEALYSLLSRVPLQSVGRILLPIGNDFIHIDNAENQTTAGTVVDADSRFAKIVRIAKELLIEVIDELRQIAPVDIIIVRGNHDSTVTLLLGEVLDAWYHNYPLVTVDNTPKWRKYYSYGQVGLMYTHGDKEPHEQLGIIFATEMPKMWGDTKYRFCKVGHKHKSKKMNYVAVDTYQGFQVQIIPSLSATDEWHSARGYLSNKQAKAFLYHKTEGEVAEYTYTV